MALNSNPIINRSLRDGAKETGISRPITVDSIINKTLLLLSIILITAVPTFMASQAGMINPVVTTIGAGLVGLGLILFAVFTNRMNNPLVSIVYSVLQGLFLGAGSMVITASSVGQMTGQGMIGLAIMGTLVIFAIMLGLYKSGFIKVNRTFIVVVSAATLGILAVTLLNLGLSFIGFGFGLRDASLMGILFSLFCIVIAALNFCIDFKNIDTLVESRADIKYSWGASLGLVITLVWLYIEILNLIRNLQR